MTTNLSDLSGGKLLFLISCNEKISRQIREKYEYVFVLHASDLPKGRGWSPAVWEILNGAEKVTVSLIEADEPIDTGDIWAQNDITIMSTDLYDDINRKLFTAQVALIEHVIRNFASLKPKPQSDDIKPTYYKKRTPSASKLNLNESLGDQFNLLRVCDPDRYPAFFYKDGQKFKIIIEKMLEK